MANREQRRRKNKQTKEANTATESLFDNKHLNRMTEDKMVWTAMGIFGIIALFVIGAFIYTALTV